MVNQEEPEKFTSEAERDSQKSSHSVSIGPDNMGIVVTGASSNITVHNSVVGRDISSREDPREVFLSKVRDLALSEAKSVSLLSRICMTAGATIVLFGGLLALLNHGGAIGPSTALGGVLIGTCGGAFALQAKRSHKRLTDEARRVSEELRLDHTREETLALIDRIDNPELRDRLRSITAIRTLGLAPAAEDVANRVFSTSDEHPPKIESGDS